jgi:hypothetical protein
MGSRKQCKAAWTMTGDAWIEPMLRCVVAKASPEIWKFMAIESGIDPGKIKAGVSESTISAADWSKAVQGFAEQIGRCVHKPAGINRFLPL